MSLNYDLSAVKGWREFPPAERECMIFATMAVGMGRITEENAERFFSRLNAWERLHGSFLMRAVKKNGKSHGEEMPIDLETVRKYVGLKTNVGPEETPAAFARKLVERLKEEW